MNSSWTQIFGNKPKNIFSVLGLAPFLYRRKKCVSGCGANLACSWMQRYLEIVGVEVATYRMSSSWTTRFDNQSKKINFVGYFSPFHSRLNRFLEIKKRRDSQRKREKIITSLFHSRAILFYEPNKFKNVPHNQMTKTK